MALIDQASFDDALEFLIATIQEKYPKIDTRKGSPFQELVLRPAALGHAIIGQEIVNLKNSQSLQGVTDNPELVDDSVIDGIIANFFVDRKDGTKATGLAQVRVTQNKVYVVKVGSEAFTSEGLVYVTDTDLLIDPNPTSSTSLELFEDSGTYFFLLPLTAEEVGEEYSITQGTQLTMTILGASLVDVVAFNDFSEGRGEETTEDLVTRTKESITVRDLVTPKAIRSVIPSVFEYVENVSVIGFGDREMRRDRQPLISASIGGKVDIYARTSLSPVEVTVSKTTDALGRFNLDVSGVDVPFYRIKSVVKKDNPTSVAYDYSTSFSFDSLSPNHLGSTPLPGKTLDETKSINARFSVYERAQVTVNDTGFESTDLQVTLVVPQNILPIQTYVLDQEERVVAADLLAKGMMPAFVSLDMTIERKATKEAFDIPEATQALFTYINKLAPGEVLAGSKLVQILEDLGVVRVKLPITMEADLYKPDGVIDELSGSDTLAITADYPLGLSQKTVAYYVSLDDITITEEVTS